MGPILWHDAGTMGAIGVLEACDNHSPIGMALGVEWDDPWRVLWRLTVNKHELPGLWMVVDREFRRWEEQ